MNYQVLGVLVGVVSGVVWEILATSPFKDFPTLLPSMYLSGSKVHLHHWLIYALLLVFIIGWSLMANKLFHPAILMIVAFLVAATLFNFFKYPDWYNFFN